MSEFKNPRKRFGQNFLHDQNIINKIVTAINPKTEDDIVEIGPGRGALTMPILDTVKHLDVIEVDRDLIQWWQDKHISNLSIHAVDAMKVDLCSLRPGKKLRVIGNLPYNISTPLLFHFFKHIGCIIDMYFMLQKEVVERIVAQPGSKTYGRLSVMTQFYCQAQLLFTVSANAFNPPPKVESAIVQLIPDNRYQQVDPDAFAKVVQQAFSQRRKTLRNCLKGWFDAAQLQELGIDPTARAETLELADFVRLAEAALTKFD
ncbi:MAG: 16S rRNA (adenine(1518)-N(6)/adenine(1519)-N(6))-dimethyltransferase RsmA [Thioalkalispiraceae bacterium]|jgi:16S rRNA (adenine1518-N6/adenine1519-N6)-dimethyltransferase